jgi:hypothetical protein
MIMEMPLASSANPDLTLEAQDCWKESVIIGIG